VDIVAKVVADIVLMGMIRKLTHKKNKKYTQTPSKLGAWYDY
tara:strand:+ start:8142 stop:8267 length:126 start_codon:yes stop_codon:yes gene_type:complete